MVCTNQLAIPLLRWLPSHRLGPGRGHYARPSWVSADGAGFGEQRPSSKKLAARARSVPYGNEYAGHLCRRGRPAWFSKALCVSGGGRGNGGDVRASLHGPRLGPKEIFKMLLLWCSRVIETVLRVARATVPLPRQEASIHHCRRGPGF